MNRFIAHYRKNDQVAQTVKMHLVEAAVLCRCFAEKIGLPEAGELIGLLHDLGKYSELFQAYIRSATGLYNPGDKNYIDPIANRGKIDHSTAGAQWIWRKFQQYGLQGELVGQILALCLASHHGGLIDCLTPDGENNFIRRMNKDASKTHLSECEKSVDADIRQRCRKLAINSLIAACCQNLLKLCAPQDSELVRSFKLGMWSRFLFSCLIDADRIDSADFENPQNRKIRSSRKVDWQPAVQRLENKIANFPLKNKIDPIRKSISDQCWRKGAVQQGIYSLTVPTGGGKTYASMRFALHHAHEHQLDHIIYIIPFTSIIEQNAEVIREVLEKEGDAFPWVLEHHSNLEPEEQSWQDRIVAENWDAPIIFTTMVQFLDVLFSGGTRGARRLHQLARSVLVFDEIQTLPIKCVHLFCNAINFLVSHTDTTILLCTATQPLLNKLKFPEKGSIEIPRENELVDDVSGLFADLKRVDIVNRVRPEGWGEGHIADLAVIELESKGSCLVIVNTKDWARRLYEACGARVDKGVLFHLSTSLCPAHRKKILAQIRHCLDKKLPVLCVSTQLIEAGVDVDFASVIRFLAGLDSIAQAAGRCNRNGEGETAAVHIVNPCDEKIDMLEDIKTGRDKALRIISENRVTDLLDPDLMDKYFAYYFYERGDEMDYPVSAEQAGRTDSLLSLLGDNHNNIGRQQGALRLQQSFGTAGKIFKAINAPTRAVIVPFEEGEKIISGLCADYEPARAYDLLKKAQQYSVNVFPNVWQKLKETGAVIPVQKGEEIYYLDERFYDPDFGLATKEVSPMKIQTA